MESKGPELSVYIREVSIATCIIEVQITCIIILFFFPGTRKAVIIVEVSIVRD